MRRSYNRGKGAGIAFLRAHVNYEGDGCLIWPLSRNPNGYAQFSFEGEQLWAHRKMCEMVNGPPPSPDHEAAHSCGKGHEGCIDPRHLSWKTKSENLMDCREHGTQTRNPAGTRGRLRRQQVADIRALKGIRTQAEIAAQFQVSEPTVRDILSGRTWRPTRQFQLLEDRQVAQIRQLAGTMSQHEIARRLGVGANTVNKVVRGITYKNENPARPANRTSG